MTRYRLLIAFLALVLTCLMPARAEAQNYARFVNGATVNISACDGSVDGIVDDGGTNGCTDRYAGI